jgi:hypothetical protein
MEFFTSNQFQLMFYDNFLDVTDPNQIIKTFVNPKTFMTFDPDYVQSINLFLRPGEIHDNNDNSNTVNYIKGTNPEFYYN